MSDTDWPDTDWPDIDRFEELIFKKKNPLNQLLTYSLKLMQAKQAGLLFGTDRTGTKYLPPGQWDRGVMHKFCGKGINGLILKLFGTRIVKFKGLSPIRLYKESYFGEKQNNEGIIPFVLRTHKDYYKNGLKILIINNLSEVMHNTHAKYSKVSILSFDGVQFQAMPDLKVNKAIVIQFQAQNFISAYIPDYGAIVFNNINPELLERKNNQFIHDQSLKGRLNRLIAAIDMASLSNIGLAKGRQAARIIWRKEKNLRKTALQLKDKEKELNAQKAYLKAVGAVNAKQLNMDAINIPDGVYAFMDMVGSATIRRKFKPGDYFFILNLCHQIAANNANRYGCRIDNFIGDSVFLQNASPFDDDKNGYHIPTQERGMLMVFTIASIFNEIELLKNGKHKLDEAGRVKKLLQTAKVDVDFRAGLEIGSAMIGPLGSQKRKIVTAIGKAVNNASRLESSGVPQKIHASEKIMTLLKDANITKDTKKIRQAVLDVQDDTLELKTQEHEFLHSYKRIYKISNGLIQERNNISFKEFSKKVTYLIKCFPDSDNR
ncbi:MAG: adenylate/guanylate cyclase domain-containing protein [Pseudomonadota bacterium]